MSIGYCRKCKLVFRKPGMCVCGRNLNTDNEQYFDAYIEHGYVLHMVETETSNDDQFLPNQDVINEKKNLQDKRQNRRAEKQRQREQILKNAETQSNIEMETEFDTGAFLSSLELRVKDSAT